MKVFIALAAFVALTAASDSYNKKDDYEEESHYAGKGAYVYHGKYGGKCGNDGLYYKDEAAFVFCSNGNSYEQPCAPGTRNSAYGKYSNGGKYSYRDFCDVNLVDVGYAAKRSGYGYDNKRSNSYDNSYDNNRYDNGYGYDRDYNGYGRRGNNGYGPRDYGYGRRSYGFGSQH